MMKRTGATIGMMGVLVAGAWLLLASPGAAQTDTADADTGAAVDGQEQVVTINWLEKMAEGGMTMVALALLSVAGLVFVGERLIFVRLRHVAPAGMAVAIADHLGRRDVDGALALCDATPSTLADVSRYIIEHRSHSIADVSTGAGDVASRDVRDMLARTNPLAVIAALSPLLGLLGTMIGMIEAFELVSIYGDEGGASMLAGSIAKALITTAVGLMIAIPAIGAYNFVKHRIHKLTVVLERDVETILKGLYGDSAPAADTEKEG